MLIEFMKSGQIRTTRILFFVIAIVSILLRWILVFRGGQFFFPDESRYQTSRLIAQSLLNGHITDGLKSLTVDHLGFKIVGVIPALIEGLWGENDYIPGLFFSFFSVVAMVVVWFLALKVGADEREALWAVFLMGTSNVLFYFSSHMLPYDLALVFALLALYVGTAEKFSFGRSILAGLLGSLAFISYNGYWALAAFAILAHIIFMAQSWKGTLSKIVFSGMGFLGPFLVIYLTGKVLVGKDLLQSYLGFANTILQGDFSEGGILPFLYLWSTDKYLLILWLFLVAYALIILPKSRSSRLALWLSGLLFVYACLLIPSVFLNKFVVYGRLVRQMVPFMALVGAYSLRTMDERRFFKRPISTAIIVFFLIFAGFNFYPPLSLTYPLEFVEAVRSRYPDFQLTENSMSYLSPDVVEIGSYRAYYLKYIYPYPTETTPTSGDVLLSAEHPQSYLPFLFEGYTPEQRRVFQLTNYSMAVIRIDEE